jgi:hypothetical protein
MRPPSAVPMLGARWPEVNGRPERGDGEQSTSQTQAGCLSCGAKAGATPSFLLPRLVLLFQGDRASGDMANLGDFFLCLANQFLEVNVRGGVSFNLH